MQGGIVDLYRDTDQPQVKQSYFKEQIKPSISLDAVLATIPTSIRSPIQFRRKAQPKYPQR